MSKPKNMTPEQESAWKAKEKIRHAKYRAENLDAERARTARYRMENLERERERGRIKELKFRMENPDKAKQRKRTHKTRHPERVRQSENRKRRKRYARNPALFLGKSKKRREDLHPSYVAKLLSIPVEILKENPEMLEIKRSYIKTIRVLKQLKKQIDENTNE